jgi:hypothetical protein
MFARFIANKTDQCSKHTFPCARRREERIKVCTRRLNTRVVAMMGGGEGGLRIFRTYLLPDYTGLQRPGFHSVLEGKGKPEDFASVVDPFIFGLEMFGL